MLLNDCLETVDFTGVHVRFCITTQTKTKKTHMSRYNLVYAFFFGFVGIICNF